MGASTRENTSRRAPAHREIRPPDALVEAFGDPLEAVLLVEPDGAGIVLVDAQLEQGGRQAPRLFDQCQRDPGAPHLRRNRELVDIAAWLDRDQADDCICDRERDDRWRHDLIVPALAQRIALRRVVDLRVDGLPHRDPERESLVLVGFGVAPQPEGLAHRSVSFSSMRRLRRNASSPWPPSSGWNSPNPAATRRCGEMPLLIRYCTTEIARAEDSSQFEGNCALAIGRTSVCPSTRSTQARSVGIC